MSKRSVFELDDDGAHIIHAVLVAAISRNQLVQQSLHYGLRGLTIGESPLDPVHHLAVRFHLPYTVASHYYKIYVLVSHLYYVRKRTYRLLLCFHCCSFVLQISQGPRKIQASVYTTVGNAASGFGYSVEFDGVLRFVVSAEFYGFASDAGYRARISSVSAVDKFRSDEYNVGCAASMWFFIIFWSVLLVLHFLLNA